MIIHSECLEWMKSQSDNSISCCVTDPPYGLKFMGKKWDYDLPSVEIWKELLRIVKPGGYLLAFGGSRTYHRLTCAIEDAGWEIRDCIMWIYGSGFPKSHNQFGLEGYGTALKPAHEPIIMAMKSCDGTFKNNAENWGQAGINIDETRINVDPNDPNHRPNPSLSNQGQNSSFGCGGHAGDTLNSKGRWPANIIFDKEAAEILDHQSGVLKSGKIEKHHQHSGKQKGIYGKINGGLENETYGDTGGASRFFYCAKTSASERQGSTHPTMKPLKLMEYLIKLVMPSKDGILLDPFSGSGTTVLAATRLGFNAIGIEREKEYCDIAEYRIKAYKNTSEYQQMKIPM